MTTEFKALTAKARILSLQGENMPAKEGAAMIARLADAVEELDALRDMMKARANQALTMSEFLGRLAPPDTHEAEVDAAWDNYYAVAGSKRGV